MSRVIHVSRSPGERRVALLEHGVLRGFRIERPARPDGVGDVREGRVLSRNPTLAGGFVALPGGATAFLPESGCENRRLPPEGTRLPLRIIRAAQNGKGLRVSARVKPGTPVPSDGPDQALRWAALFPDSPVLADDAAEHARLRAALGGRARRGPAFDDATEAEIEALHGPEAPVPGGGRIIVSPLPALVAVDVDGGGRDPREASRAAIPEIARQVVLRDLAGPIVLDLAGLTPRGRLALEPALRDAFRHDGLAQPLGFGPLGLWEMRRARIHPPLHEVLEDRALARGLAILRAALREAEAMPHRAPVLRAPRAALDAVRALPGALEEFAARAGRPPALEEDAHA